MSHPAPRLEDAVMTRRELLCRSGMGMGALALGGMLSDAGLLTQRPAPRWPMATIGRPAGHALDQRRQARCCPRRRRCEPGPSGWSICS